MCLQKVLLLVVHLQLDIWYSLLHNLISFFQLFDVILRRFQLNSQSTELFPYYATRFLNQQLVKPLSLSFKFMLKFCYFGLQLCILIVCFVSFVLWFLVFQFPRQVHWSSFYLIWITIIIWFRTQLFPHNWSRLTYRTPCQYFLGFCLWLLHFKKIFVLALWNVNSVITWVWVHVSFCNRYSFISIRFQFLDRLSVLYCRQFYAFVRSMSLS